MPIKYIIVFGASGDTGTYFIKYFFHHYRGNSYKLIATGTRNTNKFDEFGVPYINIDITNKSDFNKLPSNPYAVINLSGVMPARMKGYRPERYIDVNIGGGFNILEYCRKTNADRILFSQSFGDIKDWSEKEIVLTNKLPRNFSFNTDHTIYVMTKNFMVDMMENYHQRYNIKNFVFRLPTIYLFSPNDHYFVDGKLRKIGYRTLIDHAINSETIEVWGDPTRKKDMVYVKDFCQMLYRALFVNLDGGIYNVGTGIGTSLIDQIHGIIDVFSEQDHKSPIVMRPDMPNAPQYIMDISSAENDLGYKPNYDYLSMLKDFKEEMLKYKLKSDMGGGKDVTYNYQPNDMHIIKLEQCAA